jgi:hypothetical protein
MGWVCFLIFPIAQSLQSCKRFEIDIECISCSVPEEANFAGSTLANVDTITLAENHFVANRNPNETYPDFMDESVIPFFDAKGSCARFHFDLNGWY